MEKFFHDEPSLFSTGGGEPGLLHDTIRNFRNAVELGADVIRTNMAVTADGAIVLYSNELFNHGDIARSGIGSQDIRELRARYTGLLRNRAADGARDDIDGVFPGLEEALEAFPGQRFNVHCMQKSPALMQGFREIVEKQGAQDRILVSSVSGYNAKWMRREMPGMPVAFSFYGMIGFYGLFKSGLIFMAKTFSAQALVIPEKIGASFFANSGLIEEAKKRGIRVYINPVDNEQQARRLKEAGAEGIVTNDVKSVRAVFHGSRQS
jgi:glycerophosphoryl diester phosphodiesterase